MPSNSPMTFPQAEQERTNLVLGKYFKKLSQVSDRDTQTQMLQFLAGELQQENIVLPGLAFLLGNGDTNGQRMALEIASRLKPPFDEKIVDLLTPSLKNDHFSGSLRRRVIAKLLMNIPTSRATTGATAGATTGATPEESAQNILRVALEGVDKSQTREWLLRLKEELPNHPVIKSLLEKTILSENQVCPRCQQSFPIAEFTRHLWKEHRLLWKDNEVQDPWKQVEKAVMQFIKKGKIDWLDQACELAQQLDQQAGLKRVERFTKLNSLSPEEAVAYLQEEAKSANGTICPHCLAAIPQETFAIPRPFNLSYGRLSGSNYLVEVTENGWRPQLVVQTPAKILFKGVEPGGYSTPKKLLFLKMFPWVLIALSVAIFLPKNLVPVVTPVAAILLIGMLSYVSIYFTIRRRPTLGERAINHAWNILIPTFYTSGFHPNQAPIINRLVAVSLGLADAHLREHELQRLCDLTLKAVQRQDGPPEYLAYLKALQLDDERRLDRDMIIPLADEIGYVLAGHLPARYLEHLLAVFSLNSLRSGQKNRLRILLLDRAFSLGWEVIDLQELAHLIPTFAILLQTQNTEALAALRWLWEIRKDRPWQVIDTATTSFDLARYPMLGEAIIENHSELYLYQAIADIQSSSKTPSPILITREGIIYQSIVISSEKTTIEVHQKVAKPTSEQADGSVKIVYQIAIGEVLLDIDHDPANLVDKLIRWRDYYFKQFLPNVPLILQKRTQNLWEPLLSQRKMVCPQCQETLLPVPGDMGIKFDDLDIE